MDSTQMAWRNHYCRRWARREKIDDEPNNVVVRALRYVRGGRALDLGAGAGRDSLYLARNGFEVTAVDMACSGIGRMNAVASNESLPLRAIIGDISDFECASQLSLIVSVLVLNHMPDAAARSLIERIKLHVTDGGVCVVSTITKDSESYRLKPGRGLFYPGPGELRELFQGWEILEYAEHNVPVSAGEWLARPIENTETELIARKI